MVSNKEIQLRCSRCLQLAPLADMHYAKDGKRLVCTACETLRWERLSAPAPRRVRGTPYRCTRCGFSFRRVSLTPRHCPYCGKASVVRQ